MDSKSVQNNETRFVIPTLKSQNNSNVKLFGGESSSSSNVNQFLLRQLTEQSNSVADRFNVPKLQKNADGPLKGLTINSFSENHVSDSTVTIQSDFSALKIAEQPGPGRPKDHLIDLTTALSSTIYSNLPRTSNSTKQLQPEKFEIPFIECDRQQPCLPTNDYCLPDISQAEFQQYLVAPSELGAILSCKTRKSRRHDRQKPQKSVHKHAHQIKRFHFDTPSPDDINIAALCQAAQSK